MLSQLQNARGDFDAARESALDSRLRKPSCRAGAGPQEQRDSATRARGCVSRRRLGKLGLLAPRANACGSSSLSAADARDDDARLSELGPARLADLCRRSDLLLRFEQARRANAIGVALSR